MHIDKTYDIPHPLKRVYDAWVSSDTVIPPATGMDIHPVVGGHYRLIMETPDFTGRNEGEFLDVEPYEHVRYTWEWNGDGELTEIDVRFTETDSGTRVRVLHTGFENQESVDSHDSGWDGYIRGFTEFLKQAKG